MLPNSCASLSRSTLQLGSETSRLRRSFLFFVLLLLSVPCFAQIAPHTQPTKTQAAKPVAQDAFQQHYDAARTFQLSGDQDLTLLANGRASQNVFRSVPEQVLGLIGVER